MDVLFATDAMADFGAVCNVAEQSVSVCTRAASGCVAVPLDSVHSRVYIDTSTAPPLLTFEYEQHQLDVSSP